MKVNSWSFLFVYAPSSLICPNLFPEFEKDWLPADSKNYAAQVMFSAAFFCSILVLVPRSQFWNQHHGNFVRINFPDRCRCGDFMFFFFQRLTFRFHKFEAWNPPSNTGDHRWGSASSATLHSFGIVSSVTFSTIYILFDSFELIHKGQESPSQMSNCPGYREKHNVVESNQFISELLHDMQIESRRRLDAGGVQGLEI